MDFYVEDSEGTAFKITTKQHTMAIYCRYFCLLIRCYPTKIRVEHNVTTKLYIVDASRRNELRRYIKGRYI